MTKVLIPNCFGTIAEEINLAFDLAGWGKPLLSESLNATIASLQKDDYVVESAVKSFIEDFDGLTIRRKVERGVDWFSFNAADAAAGIYPERIKMYSKQINDNLCPIGEADCGTTTLLMDSAGKIYGDSLGQLQYIGFDVVNSIITLWTGSGRKNIDALGNTID